jgi:hypothetical protein
MTGQDLINSSLRLVGALASGESPSAAESQDCLLVGNQMMDSFQAERLMIFAIQMNEFPLTTGQQTYTLGIGGNFNIARPPKIQRMGIVSLNNPAQPLEFPLEYLTTEQWAAIPVKLIQSSLPQKVYDDGAFPLRNLNFWCIPNVAVNTRIYSWTLLTAFPDFTTDIQYPPGYAECLRYNLALRLMAEFPGNLSTAPLVIQLATESKARVKSSNTPLLDSYCDRMLVDPGKQLYNWLTDQPAGRGY